MSSITLGRTLALFILTAVAEIVGCYLPYLWLRQRGSILLLVPAAVALATFVWLLSLHPTTAGRVYAAYGGVYVVVALAWLNIVDGAALRATDVLGVGLALAGMATIVLGGWSR
jgi:small multidrug resistance family-3 protein